LGILYPRHCGQNIVGLAANNEIYKGGKNMAGKSANSAKSGNFNQTFVKYDTMTDREKGIFRQGATTANNNVKERLGFKKPRNK